MKVLFVASGNKAFGVSSFVASQAKSLKEAGVDIYVFPVVGHGWKGYLSNLPRLRKIIKKENPDLIHAHYTTCGLLASIVTNRPIIVSVLGSFPNPNAFKLKWVRFFIKHIWAQTITKSKRTADQIGLPDIHIIPNGVNLDQFKPYPFEESRQLLGFDDGHKYVIFVSNPARPEKNFWLADEAVKQLNDSSVKLVPVYDKPHDEVVRYMSAADALILTSVSEGSPNVIKEAMACNCPIVSTDVGDVKERLNGLAGCYVADGDSMDRGSLQLAKSMSDKLRIALSFHQRTKGREKIIEDKISSEDIAYRLSCVYSNCLQNIIS